MRRRGFTLLEMMLVLAILVVVAALAMPALGRIADNQKLQQGADMVRSNWMSAHVRAMRNGQIQMFRYELGGDKFQVEAWQAAEDAVESITASADPNQQIAPLDGEPLDLLPQQEQLPDGILFVAGDAQFENRAENVEQGADQLASGGVLWSRPILFYPDGSTSNAYIYVGNEKKQAMRVDLRGLTGTVTVRERELIP